METETLINILSLVISLVMGLSGGYFLIFKKKLSKLRKLIDAVDDAVYDNAITEAEFKKIYEHAKELIKG